ncbi:hypothetical protein HK096_007716, partial [Nowakowskiella sp. JEL0078]
MKHHGLGPKGAQAIAEVLEIILTNNLSGNWIEDGGAYIGRSLCSNYTLTYLNLSENRLGHKGGKDIAEMLKDNNSLKVLIIFGNKFTDTEAEHFAEALKENSTLQVSLVLDLSKNQIGDIGAIALGTGLIENDTLKEINIGWNQIRSKGFNGFLLQLKDNASITHINMENNGFGDNGGPLVAYLSRNNTIQSLVVRLGDSAMISISKSIESNSL